MAVSVHPTAVVDPSAELGEDVIIGPYCVVGPKVRLKDRVHILAQAHIAGDTEIGEDSLIHPYVVLGHPPQDLKHKGGVSRLIIGQRNIIREHVTMHPGTDVGSQETRIGHDGVFMVGAHVAHDCKIGDRVIFANHATLGGFVEVGDFVFMGGLSATHQYTRIGRHAFIGGMAAVAGDVIPFGSALGNHAYLGGLNIVGLKRRGFSRRIIHDLRAAYRLLFAREGTFRERLDDAEELFKDKPEVMEIVHFIRSDASRALCMPK